MMKDIQLGIPCGYNSEHYVNFLLESVRRTVSDKERIQVILGQSKPGVDVGYIVDNNSDFDMKVIQSFSDNVGSLGHGKCINALLEHMTSEYGMIVDCDVAFLEKDWDTKLINELKDNNVVIGAGTSRNHHHYYNFPFTIMILFKTEPIKKADISFMPKLTDLILTEENAELFGRNVGDKIHLDTAWELPYKLKSAGYGGIALELITPRDRDSLGKLKFMTMEMRGEEQQLRGTPFFTHVGRSQTRPYDGPIVKLWRRRVLEWISG